MPALRTSTIGAAASTDTVSSRLPTASCALMRRRRADLEHDAGLDVGAESLQRHLQPVRAGRHVRHDPGPFAVGHDGSRESGVGLRRRDGDAREHGAAFIGDAAGEFGGRLRPREGARQDQRHRSNGKIP